MTYEPIKVRFVRRVGERLYSGLAWGDPTACAARGYRHCGYRDIFVSRDGSKAPDPAFDDVKDWPTACTCGAAAPDPKAPGVERFMGTKSVYDTPSGNPGPGDAYYVDCFKTGCPDGWKNCNGRHLYVVCPNGHEWDVNGRASNCTLDKPSLNKPEEPGWDTHRCWVLHGDPEKGETLHVDKNGDTCRAGAGSIIIGDFHGFLHQGILKPC